MGARGWFCAEYPIAGATKLKIKKRIGWNTLIVEADAYDDTIVFRIFRNGDLRQRVG